MHSVLPVVEAMTNRQKQGLYLKAHRRQAKLTLGALAERVGTSRSYLCDIEQGRRHPSPSLVFQMSQALTAFDIEMFTHLGGRCSHCGRGEP